MTRVAWSARPRRESMAKRLGKRKSAEIRESQGNCCHYCDRRLSDKPGPRKATFDHKIARKLGGSDSRKNLVAACYKCNSTKKTKSEKGFLCL